MSRMAVTCESQKYPLCTRFATTARNAPTYPVAVTSLPDCSAAERPNPTIVITTPAMLGRQTPTKQAPASRTTKSGRTTSLRLASRLTSSGIKEVYTNTRRLPATTPRIGEHSPRCEQSRAVLIQTAPCSPSPFRQGKSTEIGALKQSRGPDAPPRVPSPVLCPASRTARASCTTGPRRGRCAGCPPTNARSGPRSGGC